MDFSHPDVSKSDVVELRVMLAFSSSPHSLCISLPVTSQLPPPLQLTAFRCRLFTNLVYSFLVRDGMDNTECMVCVMCAISFEGEISFMLSAKHELSVKRLLSMRRVLTSPGVERDPAKWVESSIALYISYVRVSAILYKVHSERMCRTRPGQTLILGVSVTLVPLTWIVLLGQSLYCMSLFYRTDK